MRRIKNRFLYQKENKRYQIHWDNRIVCFSISPSTLTFQIRKHKNEIKNKQKIDEQHPKNKTEHNNNYGTYLIGNNITNFWLTVCPPKMNNQFSIMQHI